MIQIAFCLRKLPSLSDREFHDYWLNIHGPLVKSVADKVGLKKYIQLHTLDTPLNALAREPRGAPEPFDGIAEAWWEDMAALEKALNDPEAASVWKLLIEDEKKFIDLPNSPVWFAEEKHMIG
jgi:uncharacterized protein (TIGR02118 family)